MDDEIAMIVLALSLDRKPVILPPTGPVPHSEADVRAADVWYEERDEEADRFHPLHSRQPVFEDDDDI